MHMSDALLSPAVGGTFLAVTGGAVAWSSRKLRLAGDDRMIPLMGVLAAFVFTAQLIKITIPATGSCGHLGGTLLLAILLGPNAAFLAVASVLMVQALFFADGGLLALGCNIFNLGALTAFGAYPLVYRPLAGKRPENGRQLLAIMVAAIASMQLAAFGVVIETFASGITALPLGTFLLLMQPIHLAIGILEGLATAAIIAFVSRTRPEMLAGAAEREPAENPSLRGILLTFLAATLVTGGLLTSFVSRNPDGLDWAVARVTGGEQLAPPAGGIHLLLADFQEKLTLFPGETSSSGDTTGPDPAGRTDIEPLVSGTAGLAGGILTLGLCLLAGRFLHHRRQGVNGSVAEDFDHTVP